MTPLPLTLATRRLVLRQPVERDVPEIVRGAGNRAVACWLAQVPHPYAPRHAHQWLAHIRRQREAGRDMTFAIALKTKPERLIGAIGCQHLDRPQPSIGYWLAERHWGRGYATEAVARVLRAMLEAMPEARPVSSAMAANTASIRVLEKVGFRRERRRRMHYNAVRRRKVPVVWFGWTAPGNANGWP